MSDQSVPEGFAESGFAAVKENAHKIEAFQVLGERGSGTNYVKRLIGRNTSLSPTNVLGWKHGFPHMLAVPRNVAVICVVRAADNWARSLYETPWHTTAHMQAMEFSDFIRAPWDTYIDKAKHFDTGFEPAMRGTPLQHDRDPLTGKRFPNVFALRQAKLLGLISMLHRGCTCVLVRMEDAQKQPEALLAKLTGALTIRQKAQFLPVVKRQGWRFKYLVDFHPPLPDAWSVEDYEYLKTNVDITLEAALGYTYKDPPLIPKREVGRAWDDA